MNTRAFKKGNSFTVTVGSIDSQKSQKNIPFKGHTYNVEYGEFSQYLKEVNSYLQKATEYSANEIEKNMLLKYIEHFNSGSMDTHKDSQRIWVKDKGPVVESNLGWIEHYVDPSNLRAAFEGWVAIVDKEKSLKFGQLVNNSAKILPKMPFEASLHKDKFIAPDFTSLQVITFAADRLPKGINIPNYSDVREHDGFKNVVFESNAPLNRSLWERIDYLKTE